MILVGTSYEFILFTNSFYVNIKKLLMYKLFNDEIMYCLQKFLMFSHFEIISIQIVTILFFFSLVYVHMHVFVCRYHHGQLISY